MGNWVNSYRYRVRKDDPLHPDDVTSYMEIVDPPGARFDNLNPNDLIPWLNGVHVQSAIFAGFYDVQNRPRHGYHTTKHTGGSCQVLQDEIDLLLGGPVEDPSSPQWSRGVGPFIDHQNRVWRIDTSGAHPAVMLDNVNTGGWGFTLLWDRNADAGAGRMYHCGPATGNWMYPTFAVPETWPEFDAAGRDPETNALPPANSANNTFGTTVNWFKSVWTFGTAAVVDKPVLRAGSSYLKDTTGAPAAGVNYLIYNNRLWWVTSAGLWWYFVEADSVAFWGTNDPRTPPPTGNDAPFKELVTIGSIQAGSNVITGIPTAAYNSMLLNEWYAMEPPTYMNIVDWRKPGIYHQFPYESTQNWTTLQGLTASHPFGTCVWVRETDGTLNAGDIAVRVDITTWGWDWYAVKWRPMMNKHDYATVIPRGMLFKVIGKSAGQIMAGDANGQPMLATQPVQNATIRHDNGYILNSLINANPAFTMPSNKLFAASGIVYATRPGGVRLSGLDKVNCGFYSIKGCHPFEIELYQSPGSIIEGVSLESNDSDTYGTMPRLASDGWHVNQLGDGTWDDLERGTHSRLIHTTQSHNAIVQNCTLINSCQMVQFAYSEGAWGQDLTLRNDYPEKDYMGWHLLHSTTGQGSGGFRRVVARFAFLRSFLDVFVSNDKLVEDIDVVNGIIAMNSSGDWICRRIKSHTTTNCSPADTFNSPHQALFAANFNQAQGPWVGNGGLLENFEFIQPGYARNGCASMVSIKVESSNPDVIIQNGRCESLDHTLAAEGPQGAADDSAFNYPGGGRHIDSHGPRIKIGGVTCKGLPPQYYHPEQTNNANISVLGAGENPFIPGNANFADPRTSPPSIYYIS